MASEVPSPLTTSEERLVELLRARRPDAEISVKLGLSVPELRIRMAQLAGRLGVSGRAGLAAWSESDSARLAEQGHSDEFPIWAPVIGRKFSTDDEPEPDPDAEVPESPRRLSRRALLGLVAGGVVTVAGGGYFVTRRTRGDIYNDTGFEFAPTEAIQTATPSAAVPTLGGPIRVVEVVPLGSRGTPAVFDAASLITWTDGTEPIVVTEFAAGEPITSRTGVYFMDPESGEIEGIERVSLGGSNPEAFVSPGGQFVGQNGSQTGYILDRVNEQVGTWDATEMRLIELGTDMALFGQQTSPNVDGKTGVYELIALTDISGFGYPKVFQLDSAVVVKDVLFPKLGWPVRLLYTHQNMNGIVSIPSYSALLPILVYSLGSEGSVGTSPQSLVELRPPDVFVVGTSSQAFADGTVERQVALAKLDLTWEATARNSSFTRIVGQSFEGEAPEVERWIGPLLDSDAPLEWRQLDASIIDFSPDGSLVAWEQVEREIYPEDFGPTETWTSVVIADAETFEPLFRVRSASFRYGDWLQYSRWLADSSGIVVAVQANGDEGNFVIAAADGSGLERLPVAPVEPDVWYRNPWIYAPVPSPDRPELLAYGRLSVYNRDTGVWQHANLTSEAGPTHLSPWASGGDVLVFSPEHDGHDGPWGPLFVPPRIQTPPFDDAMRFRAVVDTCLNVREGPSPEDTILECVDPGTILDLLSGPGVTGVRFSVGYHETGTYVLVGTPSGTEGWVALDYLEWA